MASTPEGRVKKGIKKILDEANCYYHMPVVNGFGARTLDYIGCHQGRFFAIEAKRGDLPMTPQQEHIAAKMRAAGGQVFLINEATGTEALVAWLNMLTGK